MNGTKTHQSHTSLNSVGLRTACVLIAAGLLSSCNPFETTPFCGDYFTENVSRVSRYDELGRGLVLHNPTNTTWLKCPAGMSLSSAGDCRGEPLYLSFDEKTGLYKGCHVVSFSHKELSELVCLSDTANHHKRSKFCWSLTNEFLIFYLFLKSRKRTQ